MFQFRERSELAGENLRWLEKVFKRTVGDHGEITLNDFKTIVQSKNVSGAARLTGIPMIRPPDSDNNL